MLSPDAQVLLQSGQGRPSVQLTDLQSGTTVKIKGLPHNSIVIRAEDFENPLTIFNGSKGERKRADFVIVSNDEHERKWIICIETQEMDAKLASHVVQQLKGHIALSITANASENRSGNWMNSLITMTTDL